MDGDDIKGCAPMVYVINVDRMTVRRQWMEQQLKKFAIDCQWVNAVDAEHLSDSELKYWHSEWREHLTAGEAACLMSHIKAWRLIADQSCPFGIVLEDDVHLTDDFDEFVTKFNCDPDEFCIHKIETFRDRITAARSARFNAGKRKAYKLDSNHGGTGGYIISKKTANTLLPHASQFRHAIDIELFDVSRRTLSSLVCYQWIPAPCVQDFLADDTIGKVGLHSSIGLDRADFHAGILKIDPMRRVKALLREPYTRLYSLGLRAKGKMRLQVPFG